MTVLIRQKNGRRSCSSRCYNAKGKRCQCICDGGNHGLGLDKAIKATGELAEELIDKGLEPNPQTYFKELAGQRSPKRPNILYKLRNLFRF